MARLEGAMLILSLPKHAGREGIQKEVAIYQAKLNQGLREIQETKGDVQFVTQSGDMSTGILTYTVFFEPYAKSSTPQKKKGKKK